jgi:hypothetical protein
VHLGPIAWAILLKFDRRVRKLGYTGFVLYTFTEEVDSPAPFAPALCALKVFFQKLQKSAVGNLEANYDNLGRGQFLGFGKKLDALDLHAFVHLPDALCLKAESCDTRVISEHMRQERLEYSGMRTQ